MATDGLFLRNDLTMSKAHQFYADKLIKELKERNEMILDFDALQTSVDPMLDTSLLLQSNRDNDEKVNLFTFSNFLL